MYITTEDPIVNYFMYIDKRASSYYIVRLEYSKSIS